MKAEPKRIVESIGAPDTNDLWLDINQNPAVLKAYINDEWKIVCGKISNNQ